MGTVRVRVGRVKLSMAVGWSFVGRGGGDLGASSGRLHDMPRVVFCQK